LSSWKIEGNKFILEFKNVETWQGTPDHFEIAGAAGNWVKAQVEISGTRLLVSSDEVADPTQMRYLWHQARAGVLFNEAGLPLGAFRCGRSVTKEDILNDVFTRSSLIYHHDMKTPTHANGTISYPIDHSATSKGRVKRITYVVELTTNEGVEKWVIISMDAFSPDAAKIGVPVQSTGVRLAVKVKNMQVFSNVPGIVTGDIPEGNIEFWGCSYIAANAAQIPGASSAVYDFGDAMTNPGVAGYGSMQIHNFAAGQVIFAYNNFRSHTPDIGIGNAPGRHPDWTSSQSAANYTRAVLRIYAEFE
jgi:sialate O-acetylesterase